MTIRFNPRWLLVSALLLPLQFCRAQVDVPPSISFNLGTADSPESQLWDLTGSYSLSLTVVEHNGIEVPVTMSFNLIQDASGRLSDVAGDIQSLSVGDNSDLTVFPKISGKVTGSGGKARVHFTVRLTGSGTLAGQAVSSLSATLTVDAETDPTSGQLMGTKLSKFSASFSGLSSMHGPADFAMALPPGVDGSWNLTLQIAALAKISGSAIATTPARAMGFDVSGKFKGGTFKLKANGANDVQNAVDGTGSSATIQLDTSFETIQLKGKLLGQKLSFFFPPD